MGQNERAASKATGALAQAIREAQAAVDLSTAELGRRSDIPYSTLRKIRSGNQAIDFEQMVRLAKATGKRASELSARAEEIQR